MRRSVYHLGIVTVFVTTASTETLNGTICGVNFVLGGRNRLKLHPKSYRLVLKELTV